MQPLHDFYVAIKSLNVVEAVLYVHSVRLVDTAMSGMQLG